MTDAIIVALITGGITLLGTILSSVHSSRLMAYRIDQLEKKVEKHNNFDTRVHEIDKKMTEIEQRCKSNSHRLEDVGL